MTYIYTTHTWTRRTARRAILDAGQFAHITERQAEELLDDLEKERPPKPCTLDTKEIKCNLCSRVEYVEKTAGKIHIFNPASVFGACLEKFGELCQICLYPVPFDRMTREENLAAWPYNINETLRWGRCSFGVVCKNCKHIYRRTNSVSIEQSLTWAVGGKFKADRTWLKYMRSTPELPLRFNPRHAKHPKRYSDARHGIEDDDLSYVFDVESERISRWF